MEDLSGIIHHNYSLIQRRINDACLRSQRSPDSVTFVAVTKYAQLEWVKALVDLGCTHLGESRTQQLDERVPQFSDSINWHFIGPLQRNKVRRTIIHSSLIHSIDSLKLLSTIGRIAAESGLQPHVLIEVNLSYEENKKGFDPEILLTEWSAICEVPNLVIRGLMTMAPHNNDPELSRPIFRKLAQLRDKLQTISPPHIELKELSMGMSGDFEIGIEEGSTLVRIGSALYTGLD